MKKGAITESRHLIARIRAGDTHAFQSLIEQYQRLVTHIVFRMVSNSADREDLCQDIFLRVYQNLDGFRFESKISTWIARIAYNVCVNHLQKKKVPLYDDATPETDSIEDISGTQNLPDAIVERKDITSIIQTEIDGMDIRFRTILTLYHLDNMNYEK